MRKMANQMKTIGVLTSGGDAPGMNVAVRSVVRAGIAAGMRVLGVRRGYNGLVNGDIYEMTLRSVSDIIHRGGTILYTARCKKFKEEETMQKAIAICKEFGMDGLITIGGDGTFRGAYDLSVRGFPCVGVPATIDNDISCSDYTIGYDTAVNTIIQMVDKIRDTSQSHERCTVVEVMGRHAGWLALDAGLAVGATSIIVPEVQYNFERDILGRIHKSLQTGKKHFIIILAEGVGGLDELVERINNEAGIEARSAVLVYVQRGGSPTGRDRINASILGYKAVELLNQGIGNRVVAMQKDIVVDYDIQEALAMKKPFDVERYNIAQEINI